MRTRQRLAKAAGYENFYAMKFEQAEGFTLRVGWGGGGEGKGQGCGRGLDGCSPFVFFILLG